MGSYTYRWVHNNSITLSETSSMLTVNIMTESNLGTYHCEVTNSAGLSGNDATTIELRGVLVLTSVNNSHTNRFIACLYL